ncbi:hypothetical protein ASE00_02180 [Sphingomonas sp. Root710]|uniref:FAD-dependent oxidoreductase n=1 Tax=Sphingomonas sp. Root710 TaxID=1736594 RepID=UPI0006FDBB93|nr:GMC family oxidoreductase [Sphingomonas sp. Root710]KRB85619.1 hypothetical protein ASE00_02180 [Sphingomonas sp. Root710]
MTADIDDDGSPWDVVIVGTGMGGAALGYALARRGRRVLFLERGVLQPASEQPAGEVTDPDERLRLGLWPDPVRMIVNGRATESYAAIGCAAGGSTRLYAAALERFEPDDFDSTGGWPVPYAEMARSYAEAEDVLNVLGTRDPLGDPGAPELPPPPPCAPVDQVFIDDFARAGLHPYRLHVGIGYRPGCRECLGVVCDRACKSDAANSFLQPALATGHAELRAECEVTAIDSSGRTATAVAYRRNGVLRRVHGRVVVLAAGALRSPGLMLLSANADHPAGLANRSGLVGRHLMFHASDWVALWPSRKAGMDGPRKTIALRDFYRAGGGRLGAFQSVGLTAGYGNVLMFLYDWFDRGALARLRFLRPFLRIPAAIAAKLFGKASIFALIMEDLPYPGNRVAVDPAAPGRIIVHYDIHPELAERSRMARKLLRERLGGLRKFFLRPDFMIDTGHPCGTCRFGDNPATSVLDRDCRAHDLDNLFVVDASFMPSSAGVNPSLTIAANALRVAGTIDAQLG